MSSERVGRGRNHRGPSGRQLRRHAGPHSCVWSSLREPPAPAQLCQLRLELGNPLSPLLRSPLCLVQCLGQVPRHVPILLQPRLRLATLPQCRSQLAALRLHALRAGGTGRGRGKASGAAGPRRCSETAGAPAVSRLRPPSRASSCPLRPPRRRTAPPTRVPAAAALASGRPAPATRARALPPCPAQMPSSPLPAAPCLALSPRPRRSPWRGRAFPQGGPRRTLRRASESEKRLA